MNSVQPMIDRETPDLLCTDDLPATAAVEVDYLAGRTERWTDESGGATRGVRARACVLTGDLGAARRLLGTGRFEPEDVQDVAAAVWAASRVGSTRTVRQLGEVIDGLPDGFLTADDVPLAPLAQLRGLLAAAAGDLDRAAEQLGEAVAVADARAPIWGAIARLELARVLRCDVEAHGSTGDGQSEQWGRLLIAARTFFAAGGCASLERRTDDALGTPEPRALAEAGLGHLVEGERLAGGPEHDGGTWVVGFGVAPPVTVQSRKGLVVLGALIDRAPHPVDAVELATLDRPAGQRAGTDPDRARSRVSKLLRRTIESLRDEHPLLAAHLDRSIETGYACCYRPTPGVVWRR